MFEQTHAIDNTAEAEHTLASQRSVGFFTLCGEFMRKTLLNLLLSSVIYVEIQATAIAQPTQVPTPPTTATISSTIPDDVMKHDGFPAAPFPFFDDYSWRIFVAINWPAVEGQRGVADTSKTIGDVTGPRVWQTWKAAYEIFQPGGAKPADWESFDGATPCKDTGNSHTPELAALSKDESIFEDFNQANKNAPAGPLIAQNRTYVRYETRVNRPEYDFIRNKSLYLAKNLPKSGQPALVFPNGSIELKAAWRELTDADSSVQDRYYRIKARVLNPKTGLCEEKTMGLVGLHIVQKTSSRRQWIWSTFEHVDNVQVGPDAPAQTKPSFNNPDGSQDPTATIEPSPITKTNPPQEVPEPVQCVRQTSPTNPTIPLPVTVDVNRRYQLALKDTVWKNYQLIMTQWPSHPDASAGGSPFPSVNVANITMETYHQQTSCMLCHTAAISTDFVFILPMRAFNENHDLMLKQHWELMKFVSSQSDQTLRTRQAVDKALK